MIEQLACKMKLLKDLLWNPTTTMFIRQLVEQGGFGGKTIGPRLKVRSVVWLRISSFGSFLTQRKWLIHTFSRHNHISWQIILRTPPLIFHYNNRQSGYSQAGIEPTKPSSLCFGLNSGNWCYWFTTGWMMHVEISETWSWEASCSARWVGNRQTIPVLFIGASWDNRQSTHQKESPAPRR